MTQYYFDYAATTPIDPLVTQSMIECLQNDNKLYGNPASNSHAYGTASSDRIEIARQQMADLVHTTPRNIIFTSGATEANNLAIFGTAQNYQARGKHIITSLTEHVSVLEPCAFLAEQGCEITYLKPNANGLIDIEVLKTALRSDTILVSIMHANNETGVMQNIAEIGALTKSRKIVFHVDAVQSLGKIPIDLEVLSVDLMSFSAHKIYGPKGIGALYVGDKPRIKLTPQILGGGQERKLRAGTLATHQIIGMGEACRIMGVEMKQEAQRVTRLRNQLWQGLKTIPGIYLNIDEVLLNDALNDSELSKSIVPGILNVRFENHTKEDILNHIAPYAVSSAAACNGIHHEPSHVLRAMNLSKEQAAQSIRFSLGRFTTESDIAQLIAHIQSAFKS